MNDEDRRIYLAGLRHAVADFEWRCLSYCLMDNHIHLLIETPIPNLGRGMQRFHGVYAQEFNQRHGRVGHLFQTRYGSSRIWTESRVHEVIDYIAMNPVKAEMCASPDKWPWSAAGAIASDEVPPWLDLGRAVELQGGGALATGSAGPAALSA